MHSYFSRITNQNFRWKNPRAAERGGVATLPGEVNNQKAAGGILLTLERPAKPIRDEAVDAGRYESKV